MVGVEGDRCYYSFYVYSADVHKHTWVEQLVKKCQKRLLTGVIIKKKGLKNTNLQHTK